MEKQPPTPQASKPYTEITSALPPEDIKTATISLEGMSRDSFQLNLHTGDFIQYFLINLLIGGPGVFALWAKDAPPLFNAVTNTLLSAATASRLPVLSYLNLMRQFEEIPISIREIPIVEASLQEYSKGIRRIALMGFFGPLLLAGLLRVIEPKLVEVLTIPPQNPSLLKRILMIMLLDIVYIGILGFKLEKLKRRTVNKILTFLEATNPSNEANATSPPPPLRTKAEMSHPTK